jgi:hypothetical protein
LARVPALAGLVLALGLILAPAARAAVSAVKLAPASAGAVRFTVTVPEPALAATGDANGDVRFGLDGYDLIGNPGAPGLPVRVITVAVPPLGDVHLNAVASETSVMDAITIAPQPAIDADGNDPGVRRLEAYAARGSSLPVGARLLQVTWIRNQRIARIAIEPAAYEPALRRLTLARRVDVDLQVQPMSGLGPAAEPNDPFEVVYRATLANYEQGRSWRRPGIADLFAASRRLGLQPDRALGITPPETTTVLYGHSWVKIAITRPGFYAVNYSTMRATSLFGNAGAKFDSLRLFTLPGYPLLPEQAYCDSCDLREVPIGTIDKSAAGTPDGDFSYNTDTFYFFAQGPSGWASEYDAAYPDSIYLDHPYELKSYYYLTIATPEAPVGGAPQRIAARSNVTPAGVATAVTTFPDRVHFEQDAEYWPDATPLGTTYFWEKWFWASMTPGNGFSYAFDLPGADTTQVARFRLRQWGVTDNQTLHACPADVWDHNLDVSFNDVAFRTRHWNYYIARLGGAQTFDSTAAFLKTTGNQLRVTVPVVSTPSCLTRSDRSALAWFELYYQRKLEPQGDTLAFRSPGTSGPYLYRIGPFPRDRYPRLFDVTDPMRPTELQLNDAMWSGAEATGWTLAFQDTASMVRRYRVFPDSLISVARVSAASIADAPATSLGDNLRSRFNGADDVIIFYDGFVQAAEALAAARTKRLPLVGRTAPFLVKTVPVSALYDQFSGGRTDPAAIRNFLRSAFLNWQVPPTFVTLLGDASYDYKNITNRAPSGQPGTLLPTYENGFDEEAIIMRQFTTDDWLLNVTDPTSFIPDFFGGRIPAGDAASALAVVNQKIIAYETSAPLGEYRNSVLLLADDDMQGTACDGIQWGHLTQTDSLNVNHIPAHSDREFVYLHTYPTGPGGTKPEARAELKKDLNQGVSLFNFVGHGSPFKVTDEGVMLDTDAGSIANGNRLFAFIAASCDVGKFSDPTVQSLGERLMMLPASGAICVIAATERAFSNENSNLNRYLYDQVFLRDTLRVGGSVVAGAGQYHVPLSAALLAAKISAPGTGAINNSKYQLMGDPATALNLPRLWSEVTLSDAQGNPVTEMGRGQTITFTGHVYDRPEAALRQPVDVDGLTSMLIEDSAPTDNTAGSPYDFDTRGNPCPSRSWHLDYRYRAGPMYHGDVSVSHGTFTGHFVVPVDATLGTRGRVRSYLQGTSTAVAVDGAGASTLPVVTGTLSGTDTQGPRITLSFLGGAQSVRPDATLKIDLFDESGIMTTAHAPQNSIIVTMDGNTTSRSDVTSSFRYAADSYQQGTASYVLPHLATGSHSVQVQAADNLATGIAASQHRTSATLNFDVVDIPSLSITRAYLFPNPARSSGSGSGGAFIVDAPGDSLNTMIRIFTISGRVVRVLKRFGGQGQVQIPWDGRDAEGEPLANGTYLFRVYVNARETDGTSSSREKASTEGRFVILNR